MNRYVEQTRMTSPGRYARYYDDLPDNPSDIVKAVQGLVLHGELDKLYGVRIGKVQGQDELLRSVEEILGAIIRVDSNSLTIPREPKHRFVGMCRDFSILVVSILRHKKIPARLRAGFGDYFDGTYKYEDHWLLEYYDEAKKTFVRMDAQIDALQREHYKINFDTEHIPVGSHYYTGAEAYLACRQGTFRQGDFGYNKNWDGYQSIKGNLLHDFNSLMGYELLPWDLWTELISKTWSSLTQKEKNLLDEIAQAVVTDTKEALEEVRQRLPDDYFVCMDSFLKAKYGKDQLMNPDTIEKPIPLKDLSMCKNAALVQQIPVQDEIQIMGARQHNLKNVSVNIPKNKLTVITGVSGSGKSSLAFDTLYAEGKSRYLSNLSIHGEDDMERPDVDQIKGLSPVIAIEQKKGSMNPRSNVGSLSGITDYLRMLFATIGASYCSVCGEELVHKSKLKDYCNRCKQIHPRKTAAYFNPNTHQGSCEKCNGLGYTFEINKSSFIEDDRKSILDGATTWWGVLRGKKLTGNWMVGEVFAVAEEMKVDLELPFCKLPEEYKTAILEGIPGKQFTYSYNSSGRKSTVTKPSTGAYNNAYRLFREAASQDNPFTKFMKKEVCDCCQGEKIGVDARYTYVAGWRYPQVSKLTLQELKQWVYTVESLLEEEQLGKVGEILTELKNRCENLLEVGLYYLTIDRSAPTLSGGELQRVRLATQLQSELMGLTYILDEPSIGLHPQNHQQMINSMKKLRDKGNTVIVVEHDKDTMLAADYIVDVGPGAGKNGGTIVAKGTCQEIIENPSSITGSFLAEHKPKPKRLADKSKFAGHICLCGCKANNLKNVDVKIPLKSFTCVTGVSGSGKSSLIFHTLVPTVHSVLNGEKLFTNCTNAEGIEALDGIVYMDQSPIGKSSRSVPATYLGIFDEIRALFAQTSEAKKRGVGHEKYFSFNSEFGRCESCEGTGELKISFPYMADKHVCCPACGGKRYRESVLEVEYKGRNIADILSMDIGEALAFFTDEPRIQNTLKIMDEVGLSYLHLNQNTSSLSGGEAQRLKLVKELCSRKGQHMLYVLDEPTTGLHFQDVERLITCFQKLVEQGHTVLVVEHNMEMVASSDWVIDVGPEGGDRGGQIVASGTPYEIRANKDSVTGRFI